MNLVITNMQTDSADGPNQIADNYGPLFIYQSKKYHKMLKDH